MYRILRMIPCLLALIMILGCTETAVETPPSKAEPPALGRYIEKHVLPPDGISLSGDDRFSRDMILGISVNGEDAFEAYIQKKGEGLFCYEYDGEQSWRLKDTPWINQLFPPDKDLAFNFIDMDTPQNGCTYLLYMMFDFTEGAANKKQFCIAEIQKDGTAKEIPFAWEEAGMDDPIAFNIGSDGSLFLSDYESVYHFSADGKLIEKTAVYNQDMELTGDTVILADALDGTSLIRLSGNGLTETGRISAELAGGTASAVLWGGTDNAVYMANNTGIFRLAENGTLLEEVVCGSRSSIGMPSNTVRQLAMNKKNQFLVLMNNDLMEDELYFYTYDESMPTRPTTELKIFTLYPNRTLQQAALVFQLENPEAAIDIQAVLEDGAATKSEAIRVLNTELLAGKGPDLLHLEGLPLESYAEKGVLLDLSQWLERHAGSLQENVVKSYFQDGAAYAVPARFSVPTLWGLPENIQQVKTLSDFADYCEQNKEPRAFWFMTPDRLIEEFALTCMPAWTDEAGHVSQEALATFLEDIKRCADSVTTDPPYGVWDTEREDRDKGEFNSLLAAAYGDCAFYPRILNGIYSMKDSNGLFVKLMGDGYRAEDAEKRFIPMPGQVGEIVYRPDCTVGINAAGKQQELALKFLDTLFSERVQQTDLADGFPVNKNGLGQIMSRKVQGSSGYYSDEYQLTIMDMDPEVQQAVDKLIGKIQRPVTIDREFLDIVLELSKPYFSGSMTAQEAAALISQRVDTMLAER